MSAIDDIRAKIDPTVLPDPTVGLMLYFQFLPGAWPRADGDTTPMDQEWAYGECVTKRTATLSLQDQITFLLYGLGVSSLTYSSFTDDEQSFLKAQYIDPLCQRDNVNLEYADLLEYTDTELKPPTGCKYLKVTLKQ